jgi:hypothetical protein
MIRSIILTLLCLTSCSTVGMFAVDDAKTAEAIALSTPYTAGDAACFQQWGAIAQAISPATPDAPAPKVGVLALVELTHAGKMTLGSPACQPITVELAQKLLRIGGGPFGGLLP